MLWLCFWFTSEQKTSGGIRSDWRLNYFFKGTLGMSHPSSFTCRLLQPPRAQCEHRGLLEATWARLWVPENDASSLFIPPCSMCEVWVPMEHPFFMKIARKKFLTPFQCPFAGFTVLPVPPLLCGVWPPKPLLHGGTNSAMFKQIIFLDISFA